MDGPIFLKSGVTLEGSYSDNYPTRSFFTLYEGDNNGKTAEEAILVVDGVTDVTASAVFFFFLVFALQPRATEIITWNHLVPHLSL